MTTDSPAGGGAAGGSPAPGAADQARAAARDAVSVLTGLVRNPTGGLRAACEAMDAKRVLITGAVFGAAFDLCLVLGTYLSYLSMKRQMEAYSSGSANYPGPPILKIALAGALTFVALAAASLAMKKIFRGKGGIQNDVLITGFALLPFGITAVVTGMLGLANMELGLALGVFSLAWTVVILHSGLTRVAEIPEAPAAWGTPVMVVLAAYIAKVFYAAML